MSAWGAFDVALNAEKGTAEIVWNRSAEAHLNVTSKITPPACTDCIKIQSSHYDATTGLFTLQVNFSNPTSFTGYDVRAVISNRANKFLENSDGMTSVWGSPMQYKAVNTNDPGRVFGPQAQFSRQFIFSLPSGENFATMTYIIDASFPGNVTEPLAENGKADDLVNNDFATSNFTIKVFDHQGDLANVVLDLMPLGGSPMTQMYDDGAHGDGAAGDGVYGVTGVKTSAAVGTYMISVYPSDSASHMGWGQIPVNVVKSSGGNNHPPVIKSVTTDRTTACGSAGEKVTITVVAVDPDGDNITYKFTGSGTFAQIKPGTETWKPGASDKGPQTISIAVQDDKGAETDSSVKVWATTLKIINGSTKGLMPTGSLQCAQPDGTTLKLPGDVKGKVTFLNCYATWCEWCMKEMPDLNSTYNTYKGNAGYCHILCDLQESKATVQAFIKSSGYNATYWALDSDGSYWGKCGSFTGDTSGIPQSFLFDRDGYCRWCNDGYLSDITKLTSAIDQLL